MLQPVVALTTDFLDALAQIPKAKQKKVREFAEKFITRPDSVAINYEKIHLARDEKVRSVRIDLDYRAVVLHPQQGSVHVLLWVDHHDEAMTWAKNKVFDINKLTGVIQVFNVDAVLRAGGDEAAAAREEGIYNRLSDGDLCICGVPQFLLPTVRALQSENDLDSLKQCLSPDVYETLTCLAAGYSVEETIQEVHGGKPSEVDTDDYISAIACSKRRFVVVESLDDLNAMLDAPMEKWRIFLHPSQERLAKADYAGPALVTGGPGTGKTVVAMHRARHLAGSLPEGAGEKILFTTFSANLAKNIEHNLASLCDPELAAPIEVVHLHSWASSYLRRRKVKFGVATEEKLEEFWAEAVRETGCARWDAGFLREEWEMVVHHLGLEKLEDYLAASRRGRGIPLSGADREEMWRVFMAFDRVKRGKEYFEWHDVLREARRLLAEPGARPLYRAVIVDEAQDMEAEALRLLRALAPPGRNDLFLVGDACQRIYRRPVVLKDCGIEVRGRASTLRINYRTTDQIRRWALGVLGGARFDDLDGGQALLAGYRSLLNGPRPESRSFASFEEEAAFLARTIKDLQSHYQPENICLTARKSEMVEEYRACLEAAGIPCHVLHKEDPPAGDGRIRLGTMHRVKGLEFAVVFVAGVNEGVVPRESVLDSTSDELLRTEKLLQEKCLLYVAATRARDLLYVTSYGTPSVFLTEGTPPVRSSAL